MYEYLLQGMARMCRGETRVCDENIGCNGLIERLVFEQNFVMVLSFFLIIILLPSVRYNEFVALINFSVTQRSSWKF